MMLKTSNKNCKTCGKKFSTNSARHIYCKASCYPQRAVSLKNTMNISPGTIGAISELKVSADLMSKGYEVYRALSPSSSCDIVTIRNGVIETFEVRTGQILESGKISYSIANFRALRYAIFLEKNQEIVYIPGLHTTNLVDSAPEQEKTEEVIEDKG